MATVSTLAVQITGNTASLARSLGKGGKQVDSFGARAKRAGKIARTSFLAAGAGIAAFAAKSIKDFAQLGDELGKMSRRTGVSVQSLSELRFALEQSGSNIQTFEKGIRRMQRFIVEAGDGLATYTDTLDALGVSFDELNGLAPEKQFEILAQRLHEVGDATTQSALAQELFGRSGAELLPLLQSGAEGMAALRAQARELGITFDNETAAQAEEFNDSLNRLQKSVSAGGQSLAISLLPHLIEASDALQGVVARIKDFAQANPVFVGNVLKAGAVVVALGVAVSGATFVVGPLIAAVKGATLALFGMAKAGAAAAISLATVSLPVTAAVAGVIGLIAVGALLVANWERVSSFMEHITATIITTLAGLINGVSSLLSKLPGIDVPQVDATPLLDGLSVARQGIDARVVGMRNSITSGFGDMRDNITSGISDLIGLGEQSASQGSTFGEAFGEQFASGAVGGASGAMGAVGDAARSAADELAAGAPFTHVESIAVKRARIALEAQRRRRREQDELLTARAEADATAAAAPAFQQAVSSILGQQASSSSIGGSASSSRAITSTRSALTSAAAVYVFVGGEEVASVVSEEMGALRDDRELVSRGNNELPRAVGGLAV